jgi:dimethylargininase
VKQPFKRAIVRPPAQNFSAGLTSAGLGNPQFERAREQHTDYCAALERCGLMLTRLGPDSEYPDSTFVEDTAVLTEHCAVITLPGAPSRRGEVVEIRGVLASFYAEVLSIETPGAVDGGDVCQAGNHFFIGLSERTNEAGAQQLAGLLAPFGYSASFVDIRKTDGLLHLKSGLAYLGDNRLVVTEALAALVDGHIVSNYEIVRMDSQEAYAANCIRVNDYVLVPAGYQFFARTLRELGYQTVELEMSEFQKMDGGLSCLSLRF